MIKKYLTVTEARKKIFQLIKEVQNPDVYCFLTEKSQPKAVIISVDELESLLETIEVLTEFPSLKNDIKKLKKDYKKGKFISLDEILTSQNFLMDKGMRKYEVSNPSGRKSKKRSK